MGPLALFLLSSIAITVAPGPDNIQVIARTLGQGRAAGMAAALGFASGCLFHTLLAVLGVAALLKASPLAFDLIRYVGAAYLGWLGVQALRSRGGFEAGAAPRAQRLRTVYRQSVLANILNPKVTLFFLVFLPQFVRPDGASPALQMFAMGVLFMVLTAVIFGGFAYAASLIGQLLHKQPRVGRYLDRLTGLVFLGLAARMLIWR